jgi:hypothetical protein
MANALWIMSSAKDLPAGATLTSREDRPMSPRGTVIHFDSQAPTTEELHTLPHLLLTDDIAWNPLTVNLWPQSKEEEDYHNVISNVRTHRISSLITSANLTPRDPLLLIGSSISDIALASVLTALCGTTLLPRLCANVRISHIKQVYTDKRHTSIKAESLS